MSAFGSSYTGQTFFHSYYPRVRLSDFAGKQSGNKLTLQGLFSRLKSFGRIEEFSMPNVLGGFKIEIAGKKPSFDHIQALDIGSKPTNTGLPINTRVLVKAKVIEGNSILLEDKHLLIDYTGQKPYATVLGFAPVLVMRENGFGRTIYALHRTDANAPRFDNRIDWLSLECVDAANHEFKLTSYSISKFTGEGQRNYHYEKVMQGGEDKFDIQPNDLIFIPQGFKKGIPVYIEVVFEPQEVEALPAAALPPFASPQVQALAIVLKAPAPALAQLSPPNEEVLNQKATVMDRFEIIRSQHGYKSLFDMLPEDGKQWVNKHWFKLWLKIDSREGLARKWLLEMTRKNPDWIGQMMDLTEYPWLPSVYREQSGIYKELILSILGLKREFGYPSLFDMLPLERQQTVMKQTMLGNEVYSNHNYKALWELIWMEEKTPGSVRQMLGE